MNKETTAVSMAQLGPFIKDTVADGNTVTLCVTGNSMAPLWHHLRNNVVLGSCDPSQLKRGDVPLYKRSNGQYVLHRVVRVRGDLFDVVGDAQCVVEKGVELNRALAVLVGFYTEDGVYVSADDKKYRRYAARRLASRPFRHVLTWLKVRAAAAYRKIFRKG